TPEISPPDTEPTNVERPVNSPGETPEVPKLGSFEVMNRTIEVAQAALARHALAAHPPDLLIEVPRSACRGLDFHRAAEVIDIGRMLAARSLDTIDPTGSRRPEPAIDS